MLRWECGDRLRFISFTNTLFMGVVTPLLSLFSQELIYRRHYLLVFTSLRKQHKLTINMDNSSLFVYCFYIFQQNILQLPKKNKLCCKRVNLKMFDMQIWEEKGDWEYWLFQTLNTFTARREKVKCKECLTGPKELREEIIRKISME